LSVFNQKGIEFARILAFHNDVPWEFDFFIIFVGHFHKVN